MPRLKFTIAFLCTVIAGFIFIHLQASFDNKIQALVGSVAFISCVGYTLTGIVLWFTGIDDFFFED